MKEIGMGFLLFLLSVISLLISNPLKNTKSISLWYHFFSLSPPQKMTLLISEHSFLQQLEQFEKRDMSIPTRIGDFRENLIIDPKDVEYMLKTNHKNFIKGPFMKFCFLFFFYSASQSLIE